jgi:hypothetical protein
MIHDRGLQRGEKKKKKPGLTRSWSVEVGAASGERRSSPRGLRRWGGGVDEREKQMRGGEKEPTLPIRETTERVREMRRRRTAKLTLGLGIFSFYTNAGRGRYPHEKKSKTRAPPRPARVG